MDNLKQCSKCKEWKPRSEFYPDKGSSDGLYSSCKVCKINTKKNWYQNNKAKAKAHTYQYRKDKPEVIKQVNRRYFNNHKKEMKEKSKEYHQDIKNREGILVAQRRNYIKHKDKIKETIRRWKKNNPEKVLTQHQQRRAYKLGNGGRYTLEEWQSLCEKYDNKCLRCGIHAKDTPKGKLSPDHIVPLSKGGSNDISNIQPLCQKCNLNKATKIIDYRL